ncbi:MULTISPECIES: oligosaccharide flippase family protein [Aeromonas]|uniref:oligosaccharide flippase family protein n=1 Tax=Aeromonas TaxID=642 RepID=UPI0015DC06A7|nr:MULTISPECIES: oligosaccharide flippase family protein [Aeromonas]MCF5873576.1 oligosaccharide flippase family protein [Aeromonas veronii]BBT67265.1 transporter [Aeromonas caviae]
MSQKKVYKNIGYLLLVQFANYVAPLMVLPYLTRILSVDGFGLVVMTISMCGIAMILTDFGFNLSGTYWISKHRDNKKEISKYIGAVTAIKFLLCIISSLSVLIYSYYTDIDFGASILVAVVAIIFSQGFQLTWFFQGIEKMKNVTASMVVAKLFYVIAIFLIVKEQSDTATVLLCLAVSNIISTIIGFILLYKEGLSLEKPDWAQVVSAFKDSFSFFLSRAAVGLYTSASTFIVGSISGIQQAALYSSAEKLYQAGQGVTAPVSQALYPYLARSGDIRALYKFVLILLMPLVLGCSVCYLFAEDILRIFYGEQFSSAYSILRMFLICSVINFVSVNFGYPAFSTIGRLDIVNRSVYIGGIAQFCSLGYLFSTNNVNAYNVVLSVLCVEVVVMVIRVCSFYYFCNEYNKCRN